MRNLSCGRRIYLNLKPHVLNHLLDFVGGVAGCGEVAVDEEGVGHEEGTRHISSFE